MAQFICLQSCNIRAHNNSYTLTSLSPWPSTFSPYIGARVSKTPVDFTMASKFYRMLAIATACLCTLILGISIAGIVKSRRALNVRDKFRLYTEGEIGYNIFTGISNNPAQTGWFYQPLPRHIRYGNEKAELGCSAAVLVLIVFPLLTSTFDKVRPVGFSLSRVSPFVR